MTTLTMLRLNPGSRAARRSIHDPQAIHRTLMACFPETESKDPRRELGVLWRIEPGDAPTLLLQSNACPGHNEAADWLRRRPSQTHG